MRKLSFLLTLLLFSTPSFGDSDTINEKLIIVNINGLVSVKYENVVNMNEREQVISMANLITTTLGTRIDKAKQECELDIELLDDSKKRAGYELSAILYTYNEWKTKKFVPFFLLSSILQMYSGNLDELDTISDFNLDNLQCHSAPVGSSLFNKCKIKMRDYNPSIEVADMKTISNKGVPLDFYIVPSSYTSTLTRQCEDSVAEAILPLHTNESEAKLFYGYTQRICKNLLSLKNCHDSLQEKSNRNIKALKKGEWATALKSETSLEAQYTVDVTTQEW